MMNVTYLFGAGASKNAIPITETLFDSMEKELISFQEEFRKWQSDICSNPIVTELLFKEFTDDYKTILEESKKHQSIDTYAKKLYITGDFSKLKKLKSILTIYFIIIQSKSEADERYDSFFASILDEIHLEFPKGLKILSWNYDYQFEKAYSNYNRDPRSNAVYSVLKIYAKNTRLNYIDNENFGILKLNGTAAFMLDHMHNRVNETVLNFDEKYNWKLIKNCLENYNTLQIYDKKDDWISSVSFAWEDYNNGKPIVNKAIEFTKNTEILVVIGYSFPFFNRKVDRDIIRGMKNLKRVYFQAPDAKDLRERFLAIRDDLKNEDLLVRTDLRQFVFPNEF